MVTVALVVCVGRYVKRGVFASTSDHMNNSRGVFMGLHPAVRTGGNHILLHL